jgi:hypothetical protein
MAGRPGWSRKAGPGPTSHIRTLAKKVWRLIQTPVCGKKKDTSESAKALDYVIMLRIADGRSS